MIDMIGFPEYILNRTRLDSEYKGVSTNCIMPFLVEKKTTPSGVKVLRINPEFRILRLKFHRKSASKC